MQIKEIADRLKQMANLKNVEGMARFGMVQSKRLGISMPDLRKLAKEIGRDHNLALKLYQLPYKEAKILAGLIEEKEKITREQMEAWVKDFDSWDVCDQVCFVFDRASFAFQVAREWAQREEEFVRRAGFALMAGLAVHHKTAKNLDFLLFLPIIKEYSTDERNFVKKAVNWALRQIGKRNLALNKEALKTAKEIEKIDSKAAKWIAHDAIRELESQAVRSRLIK